MNKRPNIFVSFLELLGVKHTKDYSNQYFNEHPHRNNLYGLSKMLSDYGIENAAIRITDKEENLAEIPTPFMAPFGGDFATIHKVEPDKVSFLWKGSPHTLPVAKFVEAWSSVALLAEPPPTAIEPDYKKHRKTELLQRLVKALFFSAAGLILLLTYLEDALYASIGISLLLLINIAGVFISWLLMLKHLHIQSRYADKICSLFKIEDLQNFTDLNVEINPIV